LIVFSLYPISQAVGQPSSEYVRIAYVFWIPPNTYEITVEARWSPCLCLEHTVTLEGGYALDWFEPMIIKVIAIWTVRGNFFRGTATWICPKEGRYKLIATASHNLRDEFISHFVPEFPLPTLVLTAGLLVAVIVSRRKRHKKMGVTGK
jgi:predicted secreted protein with PEFG-CTERM motif